MINIIPGIAASLLLKFAAHAQSYAINWYKIAGGGGTSAGTNGSVIYTLSGTIGQQDASTAMTGSGYSLTGGFWSLIQVVQTAGLPNLTTAKPMTIISVGGPATVGKQ